MVNMVQISEIKRLKDKEGLSFRRISIITGLARDTVRKWYFSKEYPKYSRSKTLSPKKELVLPYLKLWIDEDIKLIKQRKRKNIRPASTMWQELMELGIVISESTVRSYVRELKPREAFIPLEYDPGVDMQVDWGHVDVEFAGGIRFKVNIFVATLPYSNARFVYPYLKSDWLCFVDGHKKAFEFFGGVPKRITYDNLSSAVKKVLSGVNRDEQDKMLYFKNFYRFESNYCAVAKGNEKGSVENSVGFFKRRFLGGHKVFRDFNHLREHLKAASSQQLSTRHYLKKSQTISELLHEERKKLSDLPEIPFDPSNRVTLKASKTGLISYDGVKYSVPSCYNRKELLVSVSAEEIVICHSKDKEVARHMRTHKAFTSEVYDFKHYLFAFLDKPRALPQATGCWKNSSLHCYRL